MSAPAAKRSRTRATKQRRKGVPAVGSRVTFVFGASRVTGTVIEDRGNLGVGGQRLLRVRFQMKGAGEEFVTEIAADDVHVAA